MEAFFLIVRHPTPSLNGFAKRSNNIVRYLMICGAQLMLRLRCVGVQKPELFRPSNKTTTRDELRKSVRTTIHNLLLCKTAAENQNKFAERLEELLPNKMRTTGSLLSSPSNRSVVRSCPSAISPIFRRPICWSTRPETTRDCSGLSPPFTRHRRAGSPPVDILRW